MPQPIMKKYTQGEMGMEYGLAAKEKPQAGMLKKYSSGELSNVPAETLEAFRSVKFAPLP